MRYNLYDSFETLPIFNYFKLQKTGDLRYLIINDFLPDIKKTDWIQPYYNKLIDSNLNEEGSQFKFIISLQKSYFTFVESFLKWFNDKENKILEQKIHNTLIKYITFLDSNYKDFSINEKVYPTLKEFYNELKSELDYNSFLEVCIFVFNYQNLDYKSKNIFDLYEELPIISKYYSFQIDPKKTSVNEFFSYRDKMIEQINKEQNGRAKN